MTQSAAFVAGDDDRTAAQAAPSRGHDSGKASKAFVPPGAEAGQASRQPTDQFPATFDGLMKQSGYPTSESEESATDISSAASQAAISTQQSHPAPRARTPPSGCNTGSPKDPVKIQLSSDTSLPSNTTPDTATQPAKDTFGSYLSSEAVMLCHARTQPTPLPPAPDSDVSLSHPEAGKTAAGSDNAAEPSKAGITAINDTMVGAKPAGGPAVVAQVAPAASFLSGPSHAAGGQEAGKSSAADSNAVQEARPLSRHSRQGTLPPTPTDRFQQPSCSPVTRAQAALHVSGHSTPPKHEAHTGTVSICPVWFSSTSCIFRGR